MEIKLLDLSTENSNSKRFQVTNFYNTWWGWRLKLVTVIAFYSIEEQFCTEWPISNRSFHSARSVWIENDTIIVCYNDVHRCIIYMYYSSYITFYNPYFRSFSFYLFVLSNRKSASAVSSNIKLIWMNFYVCGL